MIFEQQITPNLPLSKYTFFAEAMYVSSLLVNYVPAIAILEEQSIKALANGDILLASSLSEQRMSLDEEVFSFSFDA
jgi:hypothetical protein